MAQDPKLPPTQQPIDNAGNVIDRLWYKFLETLVKKTKEIDGGSP